VSHLVPGPRSIRGRLVLVWVTAALVLGAGGLLAAGTLLRRGAVASVDAVLRVRANRLAGEVSAGQPPASSIATSGADVAVGGGRRGRDDDVQSVDSFSILYQPDGRPHSPAGAPIGYRPLTAAALARARARAELVTVPERDERLRVLALPVPGPGGTWVVTVGTSLAPATEATGQTFRDLELAVPALVALTTLGAWFLAGAALRPVEAMRAEADALGSERASQARITVPDRAAELASLARTFNQLLDRLHRSLARQRDLVADAGHELRNPLAVLRAELELADDPGQSRADLAESVRHASREVERLSTLADDVLFLARADGAGPLIAAAPADVGAVLAEAGRAWHARVASQGRRLRTSCDGAVVAVIDPAALRRAVDNLIANAVAAAPPGGQVTLTAHPEGAAVLVVVADDGPGFPPAFLPVAFGRFTRPEEDRRHAAGGAGLGLAIVAEIVHAHGGTVVAANRSPTGAEVTLRLPAHHDEPAGSP
jgi:two-component system OmpR family sensor kinase